MQIIRIIVAILLYLCAILIYGAVEVLRAKGVKSAKNAKPRTLFVIYAFVALQVIAATLLLKN